MIDPLGCDLAVIAVAFPDLSQNWSSVGTTFDASKRSVWDFIDQRGHQI